MNFDNFKEPIRLRVKPLKNGGGSLYLDIYFNGVRKYEFLKLYLQPESLKGAKAKNAETLNLANAIKSRKIVEMQNKRFNFNSTSYDDMDFIKYMVLRLRNTRSADYSIFVAGLLRKYTGHKTLPFKSITPDFLKGFIKYLKGAKTKFGTPYKPNTIRQVYRSLCASINHAEKNGIIHENPTKRLFPEDKIKGEDNTVGYLTAEELKKFAGAETEYTYAKTLFLFACHTGLRYSDIVSLKWQDVKEDAQGRLSIGIKQQKTGGLVYLPLSRSAVSLLPERGAGYVFGKEVVQRTVGYQVRKIAESVGIDKHVTFHMSRHSFATLLLTLDVDLYTVSKMLGHSSIKTTQRYAEVVNQKKVDAVDKLSDLF